MGTATRKKEAISRGARMLRTALGPAIAAWLATRPAPVNPSPVPKGAYALPFGCGSQPD